MLWVSHTKKPTSCCKKYIGDSYLVWRGEKNCLFSLNISEDGMSAYTWLFAEVSWIA